MFCQTCLDEFRKCQDVFVYICWIFVKRNLIFGTRQMHKVLIEGKYNDFCSRAPPSDHFLNQHQVKLVPNIATIIMSFLFGNRKTNKVKRGASCPWSFGHLTLAKTTYAPNLRVYSVIPVSYFFTPAIDIWYFHLPIRQRWMKIWAKLTIFENFWMNQKF